MKFDACPVEPPGFGSGPFSRSTRSRQPSWARWYATLEPTIPAPMTTARAVEGKALTRYIYQSVKYKYTKYLTRTHRKPAWSRELCQTQFFALT